MAAPIADVPGGVAPVVPADLMYSVKLGEIYAPMAGHVGGLNARTFVQDDTSNALSQSFYHRVQPSSVRSSRLISVAQSSGGVQPTVNPFIGAPLATFVYGGIKPDEADPDLTLVQGPSASLYPVDYSETVQVTSGATAADLFGTGYSADPDGFSTLPLRREDAPTIPIVKGAPPFGAQTPLTTYNIWRLLLSADDANEVRYAATADGKAVGPVIPVLSKVSGADGKPQRLPQVRQLKGADSSASILVSSPNQTAYLLRHFPMSRDLLYEADAALYYPGVPDPAAPTQSLKPEPRKVNVTAGENCGFQIHLRCTSATTLTNNGDGRFLPGIVITWGAQSTSQIAGDNYITNFQLFLTPGQTPLLKYWHPERQDWVPFQLKGPTFEFGAFSVYVHYVGPNMLIGFTPDAANWNAFTPVQTDTQQQIRYVPRIPADSTIMLTFSSVVCAFRYGPIAFNNYNTDQVKTTDDVANERYLSRMSVNFSVPNDARFANEAAIQQRFNDGQIHVTQWDDIRGVVETPTVYRDAREPVGDPRIVYRETSRIVNENGKVANVAGEVVYRTTIEGPQFIKIKSNSPEKLDSIPSLVTDLPWGDLTEWFDGAEINVDAMGETSNYSYPKMSATIRLKNIALTPRGREVLRLIEENLWGVTLAAGYGTPTPFFQGFVTKANTEYGVSDSVTTLQCEDLIHYMLRQTPFHTTLLFHSLRYSTILEECLRSAGLYDWYEVVYDPENPDDAGFSQAINQRRSPAQQPLEYSLANQVLAARPLDYIWEKVKAVLGLMIGPDQLPVLWWDPVDQRIRLMPRRKKLRDDLEAAGRITEQGNVVLPQFLHGVLSTAYTISVDMNQLHAGYSLFGEDEVKNMIVVRKMFPEAFSEEAAAEAQTLLSGETAGTVADPPRGYIGFRKELAQDTAAATTLTREAAEEWGLILERNYLRSPADSIRFSCYVTQPLSHMGEFRLLTFDNGQPETDYYLYERLSYHIDKDRNFITCDVDGRKLPPVLQGIRTP